MRGWSGGIRIPVAHARARAADGGVPIHAGARHLYASLLIRHGESIKTVQARMGHR